MTWSFENDMDGLCGLEYDQWLVRDDSTDDRDVVAIVPKTGDEEYDNRVTYANVKLVTAAPLLPAALRQARLEGNRAGVFWSHDLMAVFDMIQGLPDVPPIPKPFGDSI